MPRYPELASTGTSLRHLGKLDIQSYFCEIILNLFMFKIFANFVYFHRAETAAVVQLLDVFHVGLSIAKPNKNP